MTTPPIPPVPPSSPTSADGGSGPSYQAGPAYPPPPAPPAPPAPGPYGPPPPAQGMPQQPPAPQPGFAQPGYQQPGYPEPQYPPPAQPGYGPPPGGFVPPAPPNFGTPPPPSQHKLNGKVIAAIVAGVVIVAGGAGAAFAFSGGSGNKSTQAVATSTAPTPRPTSQPPTSHPTSQPPSSQPTTSQPPSSQPTTSAPPSPQPTPSHGSGAGSITVAGPVAVTPAQGWSTVRRGSNYLELGGKGTLLLIEVGRGQTHDITQNLIDDIETYTKGTTGLRLGQAAPASRVNGRNFTQLRDVAFQYSVATQQGTVTVHGLFVEFYNRSTGLSAFCVYSGLSTSTLQANLRDALGMIASIE